MLLNTKSDIALRNERFRFIGIGSAEQQDLESTEISKKRTSGVKEVNDRGMIMQIYSIDDLKETLYQQLQLLAERSKKEDISVKELCDISNEMNKLVSAIYGLSVRSI